MLFVGYIAHLDISITATHLLGTTNITVDHLSREKQAWPISLHQCYVTSQACCHILRIFQLLYPHGLDWTSVHFLQLFQEMLSWIHNNNS